MSNTAAPEGNTFKDFQLTDKVVSKRDDSYGLIVAQHICSSILGPNGYIAARNQRFAINRAWAAGRTDIQTLFQDRLGFNGQINYINLNWKCLHLVSTIISRMVGRWMSRNEKIAVTATDTLSIKQKNDQYEAIEFELNNRKMIAELEAETGVALTPKDQFKPMDAEELELWRAELQRLPEEILYETNCNDSFAANGWFDVLKEKGLTDQAVVGFGGTYVWMDEEGVIHEDYVIPENAFYSYSEYPDFRDTSIRGQVVTKKITEIRRKYGKQFGGKLTEEEICRIAGSSKDYQANDKIAWRDVWEYSFARPYDDWNIDVVEFEVKTLDAEGYTVTTTEKNKSTILKKGRPEKLKDNQQYVEDKKWNIYRGCYIQVTQTLLEWGVKRNMIRPQDPKEIGNCEFSYSFYMYQSKNMRNLAVPEKIEEPVEAMILARLKMQQLIASMRPPGAAINEDAIQEIDYGLGENNKNVDPKKHYDQTGNIYYRGRDAEGNPIPVPITELTNSGFLPQMQALIQLYEYHYSVLKNELGEDPNLMAQAATPRVATGNIQTAIQQADYATSYMLDAHNRLMEETAKKMACLMKDSVKYGSKAYRNIMQSSQVKDRVFGTKIQMLPQEYELQNLQALLNQAIASTPDLVLYLDTFKVMRLAKENIKLGELYYNNSMKRMLISRSEQASKNAQENAQIQADAAQGKAQGDAEMKKMEGDMKLQQTKMQSDSTNRNTILAGIMELYKIQQQNGTPFPAELRALSVATLQTVALPAMIENEQTRQQVLAQMESDMAVQQQEETGEEVPPQQQEALPPPEMAA